jgi:phage terminase large subunit
VDFGYSNPFSWLRVGLDADSNMYVEREIYKTKTLVEDLAVEINRLNEGHLIEATVCDHDAEGRATLERRGILTTPAFKSISEGIQNIQRLLEPVPTAMLDKDGKQILRPKLFILEDACRERDQLLVDDHKPTCMLEEIESYRWPTASDGHPQKEVPVKEDDHSLDNLRYIGAYVWHLELGADGLFRADIGDAAVYADLDSDEGRGPGDDPDSYDELFGGGQVRADPEEA